jgi:signal transduction histidine kinase/ligand-binding sensor domain-containing protein
VGQMAVKVIISIGLLCLITNLAAQPKQTKFEPTKPLNQSAIDQWTTDQGLNSNNLVNILQASSGYLWLTTYDGLLRFDGVNFELFDRRNIPFLKTNAFYKGFESNNGDLWFTTQGSGLVVYRNNEFLPAYTETTLPKSIRCMLIKGPDEILVGSNNNGLYLLKDSIVTQVDYPALQNILIMSIVEAPDKSIWVATNGNGLVHMVEDRFFHYQTGDGLLSNIVNAVRVSPHGDVIIGTVNGLNILSGGKISSIKITEGIQVTNIEIDSYQSIWMSTERGLMRVNQSLGLEEIFSVDQGLPALALSSFTFDREGSVWLTTNKSGLIRLKDSGIKTYHKAHGLSLDLINVVCESKSGKIYIGTDGGDVDVYENGSFRKLNLAHSFKNIGIRSIYEDSRNNLWIGSYNGLLKKNANTETVFNIQTGLPSQEVRRILEDKQGNIWIGTRAGGVLKLRNDKVVKVFNQLNGLKSNYILSIETDSFGNLYIGTNGGGLSIISPNDSVRTFHTSVDDSGVLIFNIHIDKDGTAWLVTTAGIFLFDGTIFRTLNIESGAGEVYFDWVADDWGNAWVTTNKGVLQIKAEAIAEFKRGKSVTIRPRLFNNNDGMRNKECTGTMQSIFTTQGELWIPTIGGIAVINPKNLAENPIVPPVYIIKMVTDEKVYASNEKIEIKPGNLRYTFHFTSLSLVAPAKNQFRYKLEGNDEKWVSSNSAREITYTNLPPGNYTFKVVASNNDNVWNETGASVQFKVLPRFHETFLFYFSLISVTVIALLAIYKWRVYDIESRNRELQKVNSELDKFVYSASHDLRAPLASVLGLVNIARLDKADANRENYLSLIEKSIKKLDGFISDIINFSRNARLEVTQSEIDFEMLINEIMDDLKYLDDNNRVSRRVSSVGTGRFYSDPIRLKIILSNLISNAFKYHNPESKNPFIEVKIKYSGESAHIKITDNGVGIASKHIENIFKMFYRANEASNGSGIGLYIVKETIDKLNGKIEVRSTLNEGTEFEMVLPSAK